MDHRDDVEKYFRNLPPDERERAREKLARAIERIEARRHAVQNGKPKEGNGRGTSPAEL